MNTTKARHTYAGNVGLALRRWWVIPMVAAQLFGVAGIVSALGAKVSASADLAINTTATDSVALARVTRTALFELQASDAIAKAATRLGISASDLASRTRMSISSENLILSIQVNADGGDTAISQTNAVATAAVESSTNNTQRLVADASTRIRALLTTETLANPVAEQARVTRLGEALGGQQAQLVATGNTLSLARLANAETVKGTTPVIYGALGALAGAVLGSLVAIGIGARRGTLRKTSQLGELFPTLPTTSLYGLPAVLAQDSKSRNLLVLDPAWLSPAGPSERAVSTKALQTTLADHGFDVRVAATQGEFEALQPLNGQPTLTLLVPRNAADLQAICSGTAPESRRSIIPVRMGATRVADLDEFVYHNVALQPALVGVPDVDTGHSDDNSPAS